MPKASATLKGATLTYVQAIRKDIVKISGGVNHLRLKILAIKDSKENTYDWKELVNRIYKLHDYIVQIK
jgi:hypothetical protein